MILINTPEIIALSKLARGKTLEPDDMAAMDRVFGKAIAAHAELEACAKMAARTTQPAPKEPA